jgi:rhamnose utilization protein RhaD (predicted bifunctional aldolase and dehydrogenase)/NAD(P)-dependent dehydrogenase (short-subunit alcohol dehydrogenase family)
MKSRWSDKDLAEFVPSCGPSVAGDLAAQIYATRLLGAEPGLALHGGGNTSLKISTPDLFGEIRPALFVKASGCDMAAATAGHFVALDFDRLNRVRKKDDLTDEAMADLFRLAMLRPGARMPSIETLLHLLLPAACIDHTHPAAVLALTNRNDAAACLREAFGTHVAVIPYTKTGMACAQAGAEALRKAPRAAGLVIMHHGLVTWGATAKEAYEATIKLVSLAETYCAGKKVRKLPAQKNGSSVENATAKYAAVAPLLRGALTPASGNPDAPCARVALKHLATGEILSLLSAQEAAAITVSTPLTPDYLIRVRRFPLFVASPRLDDSTALREQLAEARQRFLGEYQAYIKRLGGNAAAVDDSEIYPRVLLIPGIGAVCAGRTAADARIAADITAQALAVKQTIFETGGAYAEFSEEHCFDMEFRSYQRAKLGSAAASDPLQGAVVLVTGAAGAIGAGICAALIEAGCTVAASDLAAGALDALVKNLAEKHGPDRIAGFAMDVTDPASVSRAFGSIAACFGGIDGVIVNAGIAHVSVLANMDVDAFRKIERVNIEGTLLTIKEAAKLFKLQNTGGDIVLISTKNVFAPGASFGAYSATKAAAHQLARIASLELADINVRVNMVAPDAVFSHGDRKSGLWATVGPDRMRSRGLDEAGLEEYYRKRNLLKAKVTAAHVARAVLFFLRHETPTTGATIPVDGGLPDSTPR